MRLDLKNTGQIFEGSKARFFIRKLVSSILLKMNFCKNVVCTHMDYLFRIGNEKNVFSSQHCKTLPIFLRVFPNFIVSVDYLW